MSLLDYCLSEEQRQIATLYQQGLSITQIAKSVKKDRTNTRRSLNQIRDRAAKAGYSPEHDMDKPVPDGYMVKGVSTYYNQDGVKTAQWVKSQVDAERQKELLAEAISALSSDIKREKPVKPTGQHEPDLLNCYVITDYHLGMLAWHEEAGDDWDIKIAEDMLVEWFRLAIAQSPKSKYAVFAQLGDFLHTDAFEALTPASKNILDADSRYQKIVRIAIRATRRIIKLLLEKHDHVHVIMAEGNHDPSGSVWLREFLHALYENENRVNVDLSPDPYYCVEHGLVSLFFHHGHRKKPTNIHDVFVAKFRDVFGRTKHSYGHMGHLHHRDVKETNLMVVEQHRTLAAADAYASRGGWMSGREAQCITYDKQYGEVGRVVINADRVKHGLRI